MATTSSLTSPAFKRLVQSLKKHNKTLTVVEQCCGGLIHTSIMAQPGASRVFVGGSVPYNTKKGKGLLLNDERLHQSLMLSSNKHDRSMKDGYIASKFDWTSEAARAFCDTLDTDYALGEGGAAGPTFTPKDMDKGFTVLAVAGGAKKATAASLLDQKLILSPTNDREGNMRLFADAAAELLTEIVEKENAGSSSDESQKNDDSAAEDVTTSDDDGGNTTTAPPMFLDRSTSLRTNGKALEQMKVHAKYLVVRGPEILFRSPTELALLSYEELTMLMKKHDDDPNTQTQTTTFLGRLSDETPLFSIDIVDPTAIATAANNEDCFYANVRTNAPFLNVLENELALHAMAYANWQRSNKFCPSTGSPLELVHGGTAMRSTADGGKMYWPRQDPSMIASIGSRCGNKLLLARSKRHPKKLHTVLAGFVEAGETLEAAVARETFEETGLRIDADSVRYVGSQPWPFPQSSMVAFEATADETQPLVLDKNEIVEARWFDRGEVLRASQVQGPVMEASVAQEVLENDPTLPLLIPPKNVIARKLIDKWLEAGI